ncbi:MAG: GDSL-type esterase/lipase family protein [Deltaproteobacteria bacterium]|jgi:lysophospholipase L1-like esterase|nr:GDSL-type esterase/lipase family protein [Deltaproteobacteria bacterium]
MPKTIAMLGDSLTEYNVWTSIAPDDEVVNLGLGGDTAAALVFRLNRVALANPDLVFLQIGINDLCQGRSPGELARNHARVWKKLRDGIPGLRLAVQTLAPVREEKFFRKTDSPTNALVREANALLAEAARKSGTELLDIFGPLGGEDGKLSDDMTDDGLHLTPKAYETWMNSLGEFLKKHPNR